MNNQPSDILICTDYLPPSGGGVEVVVEELAVSLAQSGTHIILFSLGAGNIPSSFEHQNIDVVFADPIELTETIGLQTRISTDAFTKFIQTMNEYQPDIIHIHNRFFFTSFVAPIITAIKNTYTVPLILTLHIGPIDGIDGLASTFARALEATVGRILLNYADRIIAVSNAVADHTTSLGVKKSKITVIPNGVNTGKFSPSGSNIMTTNNERTILFVGRLVKNKGPDIFVEALEKVFNRNNKCSACVVGEGPMEDRLRDKAKRLGIFDRIKFAGYVENMPKTMREADLFCRPSLSEGMPLTLLEAMSCGLPPVVSAVAGVPEVVTDGYSGILIDQPTPDSVAEGLIKLLNDPALANRISQNARNHMVENYGWERRAQEVRSVYESCLSEVK
ncbi:glycosyltransferase family 4 protein [Halobellus ruber]|uniref:Glycosyltransferase family 4 protein n=1 Tax=Halobellus ruber TaxID=2761102 RepID=A0A7J9SKP6_9EURY|nr:glycosyltransferase family 4 protein [Halobellus ruber]MBB6646606.1 glycosyltransferase family 4 protein [Halobellus ruber]